jgi:hypothetical protein
MTQSATPAIRPADPARSYSLREWLIDFLAIGAGGLAVWHYRPDGFLAGLVVFVGAYTLAHSLQGLNWQWLRVFSQTLLVLLTPLLHLAMLMAAPVGTSVQGLVATFLFTRHRASLLAVVIMARDRCPVSPARRDVRRMAGRVRDLDHRHHDARQTRAAGELKTAKRRTLR